MKRMPKLLFVILLLLLPAYMPAGQLVISQPDSGKIFELEPGETFQVVLPGNPTTGYTWQVADGSTAAVVFIGEPKFHPESGAVGAGGNISMTFKAGNSGKGLLKLAYLRLWENGTPPQDTFEVNIDVR